MCTHTERRVTIFNSVSCATQCHFNLNECFFKGNWVMLFSFLLHFVYWDITEKTLWPNLIWLLISIVQNCRMQTGTIRQQSVKFIPDPAPIHVLLHSWGHKSPGKSAPAAAPGVAPPLRGPRRFLLGLRAPPAREAIVHSSRVSFLFCAIAAADPRPLHMIVLYQHPYLHEHGFGSLWWIAWKTDLISLCHLNFLTKGIISLLTRFDLLPFKLILLVSVLLALFVSEDHLSSIWTWFSGGS